MIINVTINGHCHEWELDSEQNRILTNIALAQGTAKAKAVEHILSDYLDVIVEHEDQFFEKRVISESEIN